jgi:hypothetical protein
VRGFRQGHKHDSCDPDDGCGDDDCAGDDHEYHDRDGDREYNDFEPGR